MTITATLITRIRKLLNEVIPENGIDADTNFSDLDLSITLQNAESENHALSLLWTQKGGLIQSKGGDIKAIIAGGERVEKYTTADFVKLCFDTAKKYEELWKAEKQATNNSAFIVTQKKEDNDLW